MRALFVTVVLVVFACCSAQDFVFLAARDRDTLDPLQVYDQGSQAVIVNVYETLFGFDGTDAETMVPLLATGYTVSEDGLSYTFDLRRGVRFHSGNPFTCADVEYTYKRALAVNPVDSGAWVLAEVMIGEADNAVEVLTEDGSEADYSAYWSKIAASVECLDEHTARIHVLETGPAAFARLMTSTASIVDSHWAIQNGMWNGEQATWRDWVGADMRDHYLHDHASGTGAYSLASWTPQGGMVAEAYAGYWGGAPQIQRVVYRVQEDEDARIAALLAGAADIIALGDRAALEALKGQPGVAVYDELDDPRYAYPYGVWALHFNLAMNGSGNEFIGSGALDGAGVPADFFADVDARKCFAYAFDGRDATRLAFGDVGASYTMALPSNYLGYDPTIPLFTLDTARATEHCRKAWGGLLWDRGMTLRVPYFDLDKRWGEIAKAFAQNLGALNPKFEIIPLSLTLEEYLGADLSQFPLEASGWAPDYGDPDDFISAYYDSRGYMAGLYGYANDEIDRLNREARSTYDPGLRTELYSRIGWIGYEEALFVVLPEYAAFNVLSDKIQNYHLNSMIPNGFLWRNITKAD